MEAQKKSGKTRAGLAVAAVGGLAFGLAGVAASPASADPVSLTLNYSCTFPIVGVQTMAVKIESDIPKTIKVGEATPKIAVKATANINADTVQGLNLVGAATLEGTATASATIDSPDAALPLKVPTTIPPTPVPADGEMAVPATGSAPSLTFSNTGEGSVTIGDLLMDPLTARDSTGKPIQLKKGSDTFSAACTQVAGQNNTLATFTVVPAEPGPDTTAPTAPGKPSGTSAADGKSVALTWAASTDNVGVTGYEVFDGSGAKVADATGTSATVSGLTPDTDYTYSVKAKDAAGNTSAASESVTVHTTATGPGPDTTAPTAPGKPSGTSAADGKSVALTWAASTDNVGVTGYEVYDGSGAKVADATGTSATVSGLTPDTDYTYSVKAKDAAGNTSAASESVTVHTNTGGGGGTVNYGFTLKGSTFVKTPNGTAPLNGTIDAVLNLSTKAYEADLALAPTKGNFKILGFLPVTADIAFSQVGKTTGTLSGGVLVSNSKMFVKLPSFNLFGIPIGGGATCQTSTPSDITLKSTDPVFNPLNGGPIAGTYTLSAIQNCGPLTSILNAFTAGSGNTINATLTPKD
ncbi:DUF6801 domain-containing protein [Actinomadura scrupuli]|uniref:DUF6801 domain-containing protein n=1 Tax=Actinomadura scrupuli TaxID=559629 RepID=UPI003D9869B6